MARTASPMGIRAVFSASEARIDRWRTLNRIARALAAAGTRPPAPGRICERTRRSGRPRVARESVSTGLVLSSRPRFARTGGPMTPSSRRLVCSILAVTVLVGLFGLAGWLRQPRAGHARCGLGRQIGAWHVGRHRVPARL